jgi:hypothetical protein
MTTYYIIKMSNDLASPNSGIVYAIKHPNDLKKSSHSWPLNSKHKNESEFIHNRDTMPLLFKFNVHDLNLVQKFSENLYPYISRNQKEYRECTLSKFKEIIKEYQPNSTDDFFCAKCNEYFKNINELFDHVEQEFNFLDDDYVFILDIGNEDQTGGLSMEYVVDHASVEILETGDIKLWNGVIVLPNGKVIEPDT